MFVEGTLGGGGKGRLMQDHKRSVLEVGSVDE